MKIHKLKKGRGEHYPLEIVDIMGLQHSGGITADDIISVLKGHVPDKYTVSTYTFWSSFNVICILFILSQSSN